MVEGWSLVLKWARATQVGQILHRETGIYFSVEDLCLHLSHASEASYIKFWKIPFPSRIIHTQGLDLMITVIWDLLVYRP